MKLFQIFIKKTCKLQDFTIYLPYFSLFRMTEDDGIKRFYWGFTCECGYYHSHVFMKYCKKGKCNHWKRYKNEQKSKN